MRATTYYDTYQATSYPMPRYSSDMCFDATTTDTERAAKRREKVAQRRTSRLSLSGGLEGCQTKHHARDGRPAIQNGSRAPGANVPG